jgi:hypothetical protein
MSQPVGGFLDFFTLGGLFLGQSIPVIPPPPGRGRGYGGKEVVRIPVWAYDQRRRRSPARRLRPMATQLVLADALQSAYTDYESKRMATAATWCVALAEC